MATLANSSHPFLKEPVLYVVDPPNRLQWYQLVETFRSCGAVSTDGMLVVEGKPNRRKWPIRFVSIFHAEMALATLQGADVADLQPPWRLSLSHSPTFEKATFSKPSLPQYLATEPEFFIDPAVNPQLLFRCFRNAGPLVSVQTGVDIAGQQHTAVIQYFMEEHATLARGKRNMIHSRLESCAQFSLHSYDPFSVQCSGFASDFSKASLRILFSQFGAIKSAYLKNTKGPDPHGIVTFISRTSAARALHAMNVERKDHLIVRYRELHTGERPVKPPSLTLLQQLQSGHYPKLIGYKQSPEEVQAKAEQQRRQAAARELREAKARKERECHSRKIAEAKVKDRQYRQLRKEAAERANSRAKKELETARADRLKAFEDMTRVQQASRELIAAESASAQAKQIWLEAVEREAQARREAESAQNAATNAHEIRQQAEVRIGIATQKEISSRNEIEKLSQGLDAEELDEEILHQARLAESIRKIQQLRGIGYQEREEEVGGERPPEERMWWEVEEAERVNRERKQSARQLGGDEARRRLYEKAVWEEQARCRWKDLRFFPRRYVLTWEEKQVLQRFMVVGDEFDTLKFRRAQPLTFDSIPWPILAHPRDMSLEDINWSAVEKFFGVAEKVLKKKGEYKALVEKAHRRFHPDKWRSRGILSSVLDDNLRGRLEAAGNVVAQAITPLWLKSRG